MNPLIIDRAFTALLSFSAGLSATTLTLTLSPSFDPGLDLISAGNFLEAPASIVVSHSCVTTVPEPSSILLMAVAATPLVFSSRLAKKSRSAYHTLLYNALTKLTGSEELRRKSLPVFVVIAAILALIAVPTSSFAADSAAIPVGTEVTIRTVDRIESHKAEVGQSYRCTLNAPIIVAGKEISGRGADCILRVVETTKAGRLSGSSELKLEVAQIRVGSDLLDVNSDPSQLQSKGKGKSTGIKTGIGAVAGAGLGGLLGGKKGAAIGVGAGAGAGLAVAAITQGPEIKVAPETVLNFVIR